MTLFALGLKDYEIYASAQHFALKIVEAHEKGLSSLANFLFFDLKNMMAVVAEEDVRNGQNPALTEWRLDRFNEWFKVEVAHVNKGQKVHVPDLVLDATTAPVTLSVRHVEVVPAT